MQFSAMAVSSAVIRRRIFIDKDNYAPNVRKNPLSWNVRCGLVPAEVEGEAEDVDVLPLLVEVDAV